MPRGTGRCHCGQTMFKFDPSTVTWRGICHCEDCRRAASAPMVAWLGVPKKAWRWLGDAPGCRETSPGVQRWYCASCGSPMAFMSTRWPGEMHAPAAALLDQGDFSPTFHCYVDEKLPWVSIDDGLKRYPKAAG